MKISKNFSLGELTKSETATRLGINNEPGSEELISLVSLVHCVLQPIRDHFGRAITVTSGFRSVETCKAVGSSAKSQHAKGEAVDWEILGVDNLQVAQEIPKIIDSWDQLILEFYDPKQGPDSGWIHLSYNRLGNNRKRIMRAYRSNGKTVYKDWDALSK